MSYRVCNYHFRTQEFGYGSILELFYGYALFESSLKY